MGKTQVGQYVIEETLGKGGMGTVYLATDGDGQQVAIKALQENHGNPELLVRFKREGQALRQLNHPNIVNMLDAFEEDGQHHLVMEYISGGDLEQELEKEKILPIERILNIALDLADALTRAHRLDIIHRDIKPANVLIAEDGTPRLSDFGVAHYQRDTKLTQEGVIIGTIAYLSPEGCQGKNLDARSDIWSFGVLLYEMLTGELPFKGDNFMAMISGIMSDPIPDLEAIQPDAPEGLVDLVYRMLAKTPEARIPSVRLVGAELEGLLKGFEVTPSTPKDSLFKETPTKKKINLPEHAVRFVGREKELGEIADLLAQPDIRLLTLLGPGGMGKSRLAIEAATRMADEFARGVHFVSLTPLSSSDQIVSVTAEVLGFQFGQSSPPEEQLQNYLANKNLLLIMDNFEHLVERAGVLSDWLAAAPQIKIMATSRARLNIQEEIPYETAGMISPTHEEDTVFEDFDAVSLFTTYAQRTRPDYELKEKDKPAVVQICQFVNGMPLGIQLAAGWIHTLPPQEIAEELESDLDFLSSTLTNLPDRQRSMRAVFEYSWKLLDEKSQDVFKKLCLFPASFTREAANAVAGTNVRMLSTLTEQSLIQRDPEGRFRIHEMMRQFGIEKLKEDGNEYNAVMQTYWQHYVEWLSVLQVNMKKGRVKRVYAQFLEELENITFGWAWGAAQHDFASIAKIQFGLLYSLGVKLKIRQKRQLVDSALTALETDPEALVQFKELRWALKMWEMWVLVTLGERTYEELQAENEALVNEIIAHAQFDNADPTQSRLFTNLPLERLQDDGIGWLDKLTEVFEAPGKRFELGVHLNEIGNMYLWEIGDRKKSMAYFERSRAINREHNPWLFNVVGFILGDIARFYGNYSKAEDYYLEASNGMKDLGGGWGWGIWMSFLARNYCMQGNWERAKIVFAKTRDIIDEANDEQGLIQWLGFTAEMEAMLGNYALAQESLQQLYEIRERRAVGPLSWGFYYKHLGCCAIYEKEYQAAYDALIRTYQGYMEQPVLDFNFSFLIPYLAKATLKIGKSAEARDYFKQGLVYTIKEETHPHSMLLLGWFAELLAAEGKMEEAIEVAALPAVHEAMPYWERQELLVFMDKLEGEIPPDTFTTAKARGEELAPQEVYDRYFG